MTRPAGSAKLLRAINSSATLSYLLDHGRLTRGELRDLTGLSKPTSSELLRQLTDAGLAVVAGRTAGGPGPTAEIYAPNPDAAYVLALSVRDTTGEDRPGLAYAISDLAGTVRHRAEEAVDFGAINPADLLARTVAAACAGAGLDPDRVRQVQIGVAGSYDPRRDTIHHVRRTRAGASPASSTAWPRPSRPAPGSRSRGQRREPGRHRRTPAAAPAAAEGFALLWLDHGLGLALDLGGTLLRGARGGAGEIGYLPVRYPPCPTARPICRTSWAARPWLELAASFGVTARTGEAAVVEALPFDGFRTELARRIGYALATVVAVLDPPLVVLAGGSPRPVGPRCATRSSTPRPDRR